jgi:hypothetical protein
MNAPSPKPFHIDIGDDILSDLRERLKRTRWPDEVPGAGWTCGTDLGYLKDLITHPGSQTQSLPAL